MSDHDEPRLEELMRAGLAERARLADTSVDVRPGPRPGHPWRTPLLAAAAVAAALAVAVPLVTADRGDSPSPVDRPSATDDPTGSTGVPLGWRVESYHGVQVQVPGDWAVGGAPMADGGSAGLVQCGGVVDEIANPVRGVPYVGRPVMLTDMCEAIDPASLPEPTASYVWLGAPLDQTGSGWSNGYESETVEVGGVPVTVATDDAALRQRILATVEPTGPTDANGCPAVQPEEVVAAGDLEGEPDALAVCVYDEAGLGGQLLWSGAAGDDRARDFVREVQGASAVYDTAEPCPERRSFGPRVVLHVSGPGGLAVYTVGFRCGEIRLPGVGPDDHPVAPLRSSTVEPWALAGIRAYVTGPADPSPDLAPYFRGFLG